MITLARPSPVAVLVRAAVLASGLALLRAEPTLHPAPALVTVIGIGLAVALPARVGATVATAGFIGGWFAATGWDADPSVARTLGAAAALYALHTTTSLAAFVPLGARVEPGVLSRYAIRCVPAIMIASGIIGVDYALPRPTGSALVELAGLVGVLAVVGIPIWLLDRGRSGRSGQAGHSQSSGPRTG